MAEVDSGMTVYDMYKQLTVKQEPLDAIYFNQEMLRIASDDDMKANYLMLLCNDRRDYSIFHNNDSKDFNHSFAKELAETLWNRGDCLLVEKQDNGSYEIWVRDRSTKENFCYFLFNYDNAIIEVE